MQASDVISASRLPDDRDDGSEVAEAPELWPVGLWDAAWIVAGVVGAQLLLLFV